jgi:hypothetical protein
MTPETQNQLLETLKHDATDLLEHIAALQLATTEGASELLEASVLADTAAISLHSHDLERAMLGAAERKVYQGG